MGFRSLAIYKRCFQFAISATKSLCNRLLVVGDPGPEDESFKTKYGRTFCVKSE